MTESTCVKNLTYALSAEDGFNVTITFPSGVTYAYRDVPFHVFEGCLKAESQGRYANRHIVRGGYEYRKVEVADDA